MWAQSSVVGCKSFPQTVYTFFLHHLHNYILQEKKDVQLSATLDSWSANVQNKTNSLDLNVQEQGNISKVQDQYCIHIYGAKFINRASKQKAGQKVKVNQHSDVQVKNGADEE